MYLTYVCYTEKEASRLQRILDDSDFVAERADNFFEFEENNDIDALEKCLTEYIISPNEIDGHFESDPLVSAYEQQMYSL